MDCTSVMLKTIFPDSEVAKKIYSARTKTETIVHSVLASYSVDVALKPFEDSEIAYCGVATDGSNHGTVKLFPVMIQYFDWKNGGIKSKLVEVQSTPNETADTIAQHVKRVLEKNSLLEKCITFTGDNCITMFGGLCRNEEGNNVYAKFKKLLQKSCLIGVGSPAHILCLSWSRNNGC